MTELAPFVATDTDGVERTFPSGRAALVCIVRDTCAVCRFSLELMSAANAAFGDNADILVISTVPGVDVTCPVIVDAALASSAGATPAVILADRDGATLASHHGFDRDAWQEIYQRLISLTYSPPPVVDWAAFPGTLLPCG